MQLLMVLDGNSIINRAFYGVGRLSTRDGQPTNAIYGFLNILNKLLDESSPDALCVTFDRPAPTFRHLAYSDYKANRKGMPDDLASQMPILKEILSAMHIPIYELDGWEADDLLGTIARIDTQNNWQTQIVTGDRDALQLIDANTTVKLVSTRMGRTDTRNMTPDVFQEEYGFSPIHMIDLKSLMGDASDNIPGVKGIGEKTALALIRRYGSIDALYAAMPEIELSSGVPAKPAMIKKLSEGEDIARMSFMLATIQTDAPIAFVPQQNLRRDPDPVRLYQIFLRLEFATWIKKYGLTAAQDPSEEQWSIQSEIVTTRARMEELLHMWRGTDDQKSGVSVWIMPSLDAVCVAYEPVQQDPDHIIYQTALFLSDQLDGYREFLEEFFHPDIPKIGHDIKSTMNLLLAHGISPDGFLFDTAVAAYLLAPTDGTYSLEKLALSYFNIQIPQMSEYLTDDTLYSLNAQDAFHVIESHTALIAALYQKLSPMLKELDLWTLYESIELPLCRVLAEMERIGFWADKNALEQFSQMLSGRIDQLQDNIYRMTGETFNLNSTQQLGHVLFDNLGLPPAKKTRTGYSTSADVLEKLRDRHPVIPEILDYRQLTKLKSTYADGLGKVIGTDGRIHTCFQNTVTATGRLSSSEPNLQNIPIRTSIGAELRRMFVAAPEKVLVDADYSQIELRLLAHMADDQAMIAGFQSGADIHAMTASQVFGVPLEAVTPEMRRSAKAVNFGIVYGISAYSLAQDIHVSVPKARAYMDRYLSHYSGIRAYMTEIIRRGARDGYVSTLMGRRRWLPELKSEHFNTRSFGERVALNDPIQGTAADIIKLAMIRVHDRLAREHLKGKLILQIHDELIVECPEQEADAVHVILQEEMEGVIPLSVPLVVEVHTGKSWADAH